MSGFWHESDISSSSDSEDQSRSGKKPAGSEKPSGSNRASSNNSDGRLSGGNELVKNDKLGGSVHVPENNSDDQPSDGKQPAGSEEPDNAVCVPPNETTCKEIDGQSKSGGDPTGSEEPSSSVRVLTNEAASKKMKTEWLSGSWPLKAFDGSLPTHKRKAEWVRFRDQFERIVSCKASVDSTTKLTGMKIFAGDKLLNIIEMQEKMVAGQAGDIYEATINALNLYFNQTCDTTKERMVFRELHMNPEEPFVDWVLRLELQAKFCEFGEEQRKEEFVQALVRRSVPSIAQKLYEMSHIWNNDIAQIIGYGKHLDYIRSEEKEAAAKAEVGNYIEPVKNTGRESEYKVVNTLHSRKRGSSSGRFQPYRRDSPRSRGGKHPQTERGGSSCFKCGAIHGPRECKAYRSKCHNCGVLGHFYKFCYAPEKSSGKSRNFKRDPADDVKEQANSINQVPNEKSE